jgi:hypothetical protein
MNNFSPFYENPKNETPIYKSANKATLPFEEKYIASKTLILDSRERNCIRFPSPSNYRIDLDNEFKNITSIELKGAIIPKSSYNVHSSNNKIDFSIGDSVTSFRITDGGAGYSVAPSVIVTPPTAGITATGTAIIDARGTVTNIILGITGSGYTASKPPFVFIDPPPISGNSKQAYAQAIVGDRYTATLREGEYIVGGNPVPPAVLPSSLLLEIQNAMNFEVNGGAYDSASVGPFAVRLVSQYPELGATAGTPEASNTNSTKFNRIQIINVNSDPWELLFCTGPNKMRSSNRILGFNITDFDNYFSTPAVVVGAGTLIPAGTSIRAPYDYNLVDDPEFVIMELYAGNQSFDRTRSVASSVDHKFAVLFFDSNNPSTLHDLSSGTGGTITTVSNVDYLEGNLGKGAFWREQGRN